MNKKNMKNDINKQATNLRGFLASMNPRFKDRILVFYLNLNSIIHKFESGF